MEALFEMCESTINIFPSLHQEPLIKNFLNDIEMDLNSNIIRDEFGDVSDWPIKQILFGGDQMYQGCLVDINEKIDQSFNMVKSYIKVRLFSYFNLKGSSSYVKDKKSQAYVLRDIDISSTCQAVHLLYVRVSLS